MQFYAMLYCVIVDCTRAVSIQGVCS